MESVFNVTDLIDWSIEPYGPNEPANEVSPSDKVMVVLVANAAFAWSLTNAILLSIFLNDLLIRALIFLPSTIW